MSFMSFVTGYTMKNAITVQTVVNALMEKVWERFVKCEAK